MQFPLNITSWLIKIMKWHSFQSINQYLRSIYFERGDQFLEVVLQAVYRLHFSWLGDTFG